MSKKALLIVVIGVVLIVGGGYWFANLRERTSELEDGTKVVSAPRGKVISGFPEEFLIETAAVEESYRLQYESGVHQPVLVYASTRSFEENLDAFRDRLSQGGWIIIKEDTSAPVGSLYGRKGQEDVNVTVTAKEEGVGVSIAYVRLQ